METRKQELLQLRSQINEIDAEFSMILQSLQWDKKQLLEDKTKVICKYNDHHRVSQETKESHEVQCRLATNSYSKEDKLLPDPPDNNANTLIRLSKDDIQQIITQAASLDSSFKKGTENVDIEPQTLDRLQSTYTGDERRAIYDAVVQAAPFCHDLSDLALPSVQGQDDTTRKQKSRLEILAGLRNMRRRRTKYRVAAKTRNYSDVLRDVIKTQMEMHSDVKIEKSDEATTSSGTSHQVEVKLEPRSPSPSRNGLSRPTVYSDNIHNHKRNNYDEDRPSNSRKTKHYDKTDSRTRHKDYRDKRYDDYKGGRDRHSNRDGHKYEDRYNDKRIKDRERTKYNRHHKNHEDVRTKEIKKESDTNEREKHYSSRDIKEDYETRNKYEDVSHKEIKKEKDVFEKEKHYSSRDQTEEQYKSKSYYNSYDYESRKAKKKCSEYRK